jgi:pimeloyl-ACP methyl ester carboxylesterase
MKTVETELLGIAVEEGGPERGFPVLLLHGWPDAPCGLEFLASRLQMRGWRTVVPYLRGSGATRFLSEEMPRVGSGVALAQDAMLGASRRGWRATL